jgi:hypothetical protein
MATTVFDNHDAPYLQWLHDHPAGFVVNTTRRYNPSYMVLHKTSCYSISRTTDQMDENPFTGRGYVKICSIDQDGLLVWIRQQGGTGFTKRCSICRA